MNKRGFHCAPSFCRFTSSSSSILLSFSPPYFPRLLTHFYFLSFSFTPAGLKPLTFRIALAYQSLFYTTTLQGSVENYPWKNMFILLYSLTSQKIYITIYLFICLKHILRCTKTRIGFLINWVPGEFRFFSAQRLLEK